MEKPIKIAVCLVGQVRTSHITWWNIKEYLRDFLDDCDFYIHTWDVNTLAPGVETLAINPRYISNTLVNQVPQEHFDKLKEVYNPKKFCIDKFTFDPNIFPPGFYISLNKTLDMLEGDYDLIIVARPDLVIDRSKKLKYDLEFLDKSNFLYTDMFEDGDRQIDSALWIFRPFLKETIQDFCNDIIESTAHVDDQIFLKEWLEAVGEFPKAVHNKNIWIYRLMHQRKMLPPGWLTVKYYDIKHRFK